MAPPIQKLEHWTLVTNDMAQTKHFYLNVLGADGRSGNGPEGAVLGGVLIDFFEASERSQPQPGTVGQHHAYVVNVEDFDPWVEHLRSSEVEFRLAHHGLGRMSIYVDDPSGYHIELTAPFETSEQGRAEMIKRGIISDSYTEKHRGDA
jgi:catechol-2,3-dioxygenase